MPTANIVIAMRKSIPLVGAALLLVGVACVPGTASAQNIIKDGDFSGGGTSTQALTNDNVSHPIDAAADWTYQIHSSQDGCVVGSQGSGGYGAGGCGFGWQTGTGQFSNPSSSTLPYYAVQIEAAPGTNSLLQSLTLTANSTYTLTFNQAAANDGGSSGDAISWTINLGGTGPTFSGGTCNGANSCTTSGTATPGNSFTSTAWVPEIFTIKTGSSVGSNLITFMANAVNPSGPPVALLDSISLTRNSVPEPASFVLLGLGLLGAAAVRRRVGAARSIPA